MTSPGTGDEPTGSPEAAPDPAAAPLTPDATFDPFRFGRPDPGSPAAAAYPHLFPPQPVPDRFPPGHSASIPYPPGHYPPPDPSSGYGYPTPGYPPLGYDQPPPTQPGQAPYGFPPPGYAVPGYGYPGTAPTAKPGNGRAVAGLILGICSVVFFFFTLADLPVVVLGVIYSSLGLKASRAGLGQRGLALAGMVLSTLGAVLVVACTVFLLHQINHCQLHHDQGTRAYNECIVHF